jgi:hypothetical protein
VSRKPVDATAHSSTRNGAGNLNGLRKVQKRTNRAE